ncbi:UvrD-helicase domain-containing protein [Natronococcus roseus]|uniref:UvrD-helicase domain-containing protein n=1 Tax=Natronococcus roseus TaxID=1052014 RepID=UPI00374D5055
MTARSKVEYKTYEEVESWIEESPTGPFSGILPGPLYRLLFGTQPPDPDLINTRRQQVHQRYRKLVSKYRSLCNRLSIPADAESISSSNKGLILAFEDPLVRPKSTTKKTDLEEQQLTLEITADRAETLHNDIESLLKGTDRRYLRVDEQQQLEIAVQMLKAYARAVRTERNRIRAIQFTQQIDQWQAQLADLEDRMEPYLTYKRETIDDELKTALKRFLQKIATAEESFGTGQLSDDNRSELERIKRRANDLSSHLEGYRSEYLSRLFEQTTADIEGKIIRVQRDLGPTKHEGKPLKQKSAIQQEIAATEEEIAGLRDQPFADHLDHSGNQTLDSLQEQIDNIEAYLEAKTSFDNCIVPVERRVTSLKNHAAPYLEYDQYLTRVDRIEMEQKITRATTALETCQKEVALEQLGTPDRERFGEATEVVAAVKSCLDSYNGAFVKRERTQYEDLLTGIGSGELDLTTEQQRAVVRNGTYNQVIAAAGTGKTLTLTTRVAYLIESQGVAPERILVIAFTREARNEMEERLARHFGITEVRVETVHAFGNSIIQSATDGAADPIDPNQIRNFVDRFINTDGTEVNNQFQSHYYDFLVHFDDVYLTESDFETKEAYVQARAEQRYQTLRDEEVKSRAEKQIADFLFTHQIEYRYEDIATWAETDDEKGSYEPDFYLPKYEIYIEHHGIDSAGEVAPWFTRSTEQYHEKIRWARTQFEAGEPTLVETYDFEHSADMLDRTLRSRLKHHGVEFDQMNLEELIDSAFDYNQREGWIKGKFVDFIQNAKRFDVKPDAIEDQLNQNNPRQYHFGRCGIILLQQYQRFLIENELIDYSDMINQALDMVQENQSQYRSQYDHVLVDEFQDIGKGKLDLIKEFVGANAARLFAVGDDWQSIYSFQGAVVEYFLNFDENFGTPTRTTLTENFRSPTQVIEAGNTLIEANDGQIEKTVNATIAHETTPLVHTLQGYAFYDYVHRVSRYTVGLINEYLNRGADPEDIMVLCRFDGAVPYLDEIKSELREYEIPYEGKSDTYHGSGGKNSGVAVYSVYQSKGREAEHVILVHTAEGQFGFPPAGRKNELLEPVKPVEGNTVAEERRAFYVAITRSQRTLDILTRKGKESRFLEEIEDFTEELDRSDSIEPLDDVGSEMSITAKVNHLFDDVHPKKHQDGYLVDQYGGSARFVSWENNNPPTLEYKEWYRFDGVRVDQFEDRKELVVTRKSSIANIDDPAPAFEFPTTDDQQKQSSTRSAKRVPIDSQLNQNCCEKASSFAPKLDSDQKQESLSSGWHPHHYWHLVATADLGWQSSIEPSEQ